MVRSTLLSSTFFCAGILAPVAAAQVKEPAQLPYMPDVKTAPLAPPADDATRNPLPIPVSASEDARAPAIPQSLQRELPYPIYDVDESGAVWVVGKTYKARFGSEGATYVPFLGSRAPRNFPVTFNVSTVTSAGQPVAFEAVASAHRTGDVVAFERGSFVEEYAIASDSIEQRFVFRSLPSRGEIVVSIDVTSDLEGKTDASGFRFENALGHVRYGRAFALDARGSKIGIESRLENGRIDLVVPASFVETAEFPLVVDPYAGTITVDADSDSDWQADVAYDASTNRFAVVYERQFSAADHDIFVRAYVDQVWVDTATIDASVIDWRNPKIANNGIANQFLCVAQAGDAGSRIIRGRTCSAASLTTGAQFTISGAETGDKLNPDVGGDPISAPPTYYCVVWQRQYSSTDTDIHARLVTSSSTLLGPSTILLENSAATLDSLPSISKTDGLDPAASQDWQVVWQHETTSTNDDIQGARIHWNGNITSSTFFVASTTENERAPSASEPLNNTAPGRPWLAAYTIGSDLRLRVFEDTAVQGTTDIASGLFGGLGQPVVTIDGRKFAFAYTSNNGLFPNPDIDLHAGTLNFIDGVMSFAETLVLASSSADDESHPEIASSYTATLTGPWRTYVTYDVFDSVNEYDVYYAVYDIPTNAGGYLYCTGTAAACPCGNGNDGSLGNAGCASSVNPGGARLDVGGTWYVSADTAVLYGQGMPANATCLFFQGTTQITNGTPFGDGLRCASGTVIRLGTKTCVGGQASYGYSADTPIHTKGLVSAAGGWRYYQCWYRNSAAYCTSSTFNLTNGFARLWTP
jgi:hypothetical protein